MLLICPKCRNSIEWITDPTAIACTCPGCGSVLCPDDAGDATVKDTIAAAESTSLLLQCQKIGRFQIECELGHGGYGTVFKAHDSKLQRLVAVKVPRHGGGGTEKERQRFLREARNASRLHHPGIVPIFDLGESDGLVYIVSEFVDGSTLAALLPPRKLSFREAAEIVASVSDGLQAAHESGVVHRDIKPSNIIIDRSGQPHLTDFGMARQFENDATLTVEGQVLGTPAYMSPEQAAGNSHRVDRRTDTYGLGVVLYELLTGERPFHGTTQMVIQQVLSDDPKNPRSLNSGIPHDLETICLKAIDKVPDRRYQSARELADDLRRWLRNEPVQARRIGALGRAYRWVRRNPSLASMSAVAGLLLILVAAGATAATIWVAAARRQTHEAHAALDGSMREAHRAFEQYYLAVSDNPLLDAPSIQPLLREILQAAINDCQQFLTQYGDEPQLAPEVAATYIRLAQLQLASGASDAAVASTEHGVERLEQLLAGHPSVEQLKPLSVGLFHFPQYSQGRGAIGPSDPARGLAALNRAVAIWERLASEHPEVSGFEHDRAGMYFYLDLSCRAAGDKAGSLHAIQRAIDILAELVRRNPENRGYRRELSQFYSVSGDAFVILGNDLAEGLKRQERAVAIDPSNPRPLARMAWNLATYPDRKQRDPRRAIEFAKKATAIEPQNPLHWRVLGVAQYRAGNWVAAIDSLEKSMILQNGGEGVDLYTAAMAYWQTGNKTRAREFFQKADAWKKKEHVISADLEGLDGEAASLVAFGR
jgi:tetratricopeptide (TPR) repeat protein/ribosomal protein S27E